MTPTTPGQDFLNRFVAEKLPEYPMGSSEIDGDPPSFATDVRYVPLRDPVQRS